MNEHVTGNDVENLRSALREVHFKNKQLKSRLNERSALLPRATEQLEVTKLDNEHFQQELSWIYRQKLTLFKSKIGKAVRNRNQ